MLKRLAIENRRKLSRQLFFQLHQEADIAISCSTVRRRLHESELHSRRPHKKPLLMDEHCRLRRECVAMYRDWDVEAWRSVLFSDEAKISIGNDRALHVWRRNYIKLREKSICRSAVI